MLATVLRPLAAALALIALSSTLLAIPALADEPDWDPSSAVAAYADAFNRHDLNAAVALFDDYGSATDGRGRHFEGTDGLTDFLLASGFEQQGASIKTERLHVVANRAVWTYSCSCSSATTEVRLVTNHNHISVFAVIPPAAGPIQRSGLDVVPWLFAAGLALLTLLGGGWAFRRHRRAEQAAPPRRAAQGQLLLALAAARSINTYSSGITTTVPTMPSCSRHR
jgi:hypothetical protein